MHGVPLDKLFKAARVSGEAIPVRIAVAIVGAVLAGLHAAHETRDEKGEPLRIVHRGVSPQNVIVGVDGIPRLLDFGIAKARSCAHVTRAGLFKGKLAYMAPEQVRAEEVTLAADIYGAGVLLRELLAQRRLHAGSHDLEILTSVASGNIPSLSATLAQMGISRDDERAKLVGAIEPVVLRALSPRPQDRQSSAAEMLDSLVQRCPAATPLEVASWVKDLRGRLPRTPPASPLVDRGAVALALQDGRSVFSGWVTGLRCAGRGARASCWDERTDHPEGRSDRTARVGASNRRVARASAPLACVDGHRSLAARLRDLARPRHGDRPRRATAARTGDVFAGGRARHDRRRPLGHGARSAPPPPATIEIAEPPPPATQPTPVRATHPFAIFSTPIVHRPPPRPPPPPQRETSSGPTTTTATIPTQGTTPAKVDCDPPFYFEGSKKIFKTGCI